MKSAEVYVVRKTADVLDRSQEQVIDWGFNKIGENLYENKKY